MIELLVPLLFLSVFAYAAAKKVKVFDSFVLGAREGVPLLLSLFPYIFAVLTATELMQESGLSDKLLSFLSPVFAWLKIPQEIGKLVLLKPFSGSGSTALLDEILTRYGADGYIAKCACVCYGSSETVFYVGAVYFAGSKNKNLALPIGISLAANFLSVVFGCFLCRIL